MESFSPSTEEGKIKWRQKSLGIHTTAHLRVSLKNFNFSMQWKLNTFSTILDFNPFSRLQVGGIYSWVVLSGC